jgi:hypothetical protein
MYQMHQAYALLKLKERESNSLFPRRNKNEVPSQDCSRNTYENEM